MTLKARTTGYKVYPAEHSPTWVLAAGTTVGKAGLSKPLSKPAEGALTPRVRIHLPRFVERSAVEEEG
jgi:hypothetical protein